MIARKSSQEVEIDHLLAEEFSCDPSFVRRFVEECGVPCVDLVVASVAAEPSLDGEGFGDLLVAGSGAAGRIALLIEDKITAGPAVRQAARYAAHAARMRTRGWSQVWTILVAPAAYQGERSGYDATIDLETIADIIGSPDPARLAYRRAVIDRALMKKASTGVRIADPAMHSLRSAYLDFVSIRPPVADGGLSFPLLRGAYYDGDSWVEPIRSSALPIHVWLRHRLWTSTKAKRGSVDLIVSPATAPERRLLEARIGEDLTIAPYSANKGCQVSIAIPEMRQTRGFEPEIAAEALLAMRSLIEWYRSQPGDDG